MLAAAACALARGAPLLLALSAVAVHAVLRKPGRAAVLRLEGNGCWSLPERGRHGLELRAGTRYTALWAYLVLQTDGGPEFRILLIRDQLPAADWRRLQAELRR